MEQPYCKLCRHRHPRGAPHIFDLTTEDPRPEVVLKQGAAPQDQADQTQELGMGYGNGEAERALRAYKRHREKSKLAMRRYRARKQRRETDAV